MIQKTCQVATIKDFLVAPTLKPHLSDAETAYSGPQADTAINHPKKTLEKTCCVRLDLIFQNKIFVYKHIYIYILINKYNYIYYNM